MTNIIFILPIVYRKQFSNEYDDNNAKNNMMTLITITLTLTTIITGGDFPEEMGANLESGLMMENENALKSRKDEDSDE